MRRLILFMHTTLDGFVAGPNGEMDWIKVGDEIFDYAAQRTQEADTALYGRVTYEMMQAYWPGAGQRPNASKHDIEHSSWYNAVTKVVISASMQGQLIPKTRIIGGDVAAEVAKLKQEPGKDILMLGSPGALQPLIANGLIDEYWLFVNPVLLGRGIPLFTETGRKADLALIRAQAFSSGVVCLHYTLK